MSTIFVSLPDNLEEFVNKMVNEGRVASKADVVRKALSLLFEKEAAKTVFIAQREIKLGKGLKGDLKELAKKLK